MRGKLISDNQTLNGAKYRSGYEIQTYDDGFGPLWISRKLFSIVSLTPYRASFAGFVVCPASGLDSARLT